MQENVTLLNDDEINEFSADPEVLEFIEQQNKERKELIEKEANRRIRKNKREIKRLHSHAQQCLIDGNKAGYMYAINKLRVISGHPVSNDILETLWKTSREQVIKIATSFAEAQANLPEGQNFSV